MYRRIIGGDSIRLRLDFSLKTVEERRAFVDKYLKNLPNPTQEELEMCANYILWGKNENGLSAVQEKDIFIETKHKTWNNANKVESLDALLDNPAFNESTLQDITAAAPKIPKQVFDRETALANADGWAKETLERLFRQIDETELVTNFYEVAHGKRKTEPRAALMHKFSDDELVALRERAGKLSQYDYLKMRHLLVELRQEQYTVRDSFAEKVGMGTVPRYISLPPDKPAFGTDVVVLPLGMVNNDHSFIFQDFDKLIPANFDDAALRRVSQYYWEMDAVTGRSFDFRDAENLFQLILMIGDYEGDEFAAESTMPQLMATFRYYEKAADFNEIQHNILDMKIQHYKNQEIADAINREYGKHYNANYISTIFRQKIIKNINAAASYHKELVGNLFFPENFKRCSRCHRVFLKHERNFVQKKHSGDGFSGRCKLCDREVRKLKKEQKKNEQKKATKTANGLSPSTN